MTLLAVSLLVFSITIVFTLTLLIIWWKKYGKFLFDTFKSIKNTQNPKDFMKNIGNLNNLEDFYRNMGSFGGQMGNFNSRMSEIAKKLTKK